MLHFEVPLEGDVGARLQIDLRPVPDLVERDGRRFAAAAGDSAVRGYRLGSAGVVRRHVRVGQTDPVLRKELAAFQPAGGPASVELDVRAGARVCHPPVSGGGFYAILCGHVFSLLPADALGAGGVRSCGGEAGGTGRPLCPPRSTKVTVSYLEWPRFLRSVTRTRRAQGREAVERGHPGRCMPRAPARVGPGRVVRPSRAEPCQLGGMPPLDRPLVHAAPRSVNTCVSPGQRGLPGGNRPRTRGGGSRCDRLAGDGRRRAGREPRWQAQNRVRGGGRRCRCEVRPGGSRGAARECTAAARRNTWKRRGAGLVQVSRLGKVHCCRFERHGGHRLVVASGISARCRPVPGQAARGRLPMVRQGCPQACTRGCTRPPRA